MTPEREAEIRKMLADLASVLGEGPHACAWSDPEARAACPPDEILCPWHEVHDTHAALIDLLAALDEEREWGEPELVRNQPCGCRICVCASTERCGGCGARYCAKHRESGLLHVDPSAVWAPHPLIARAETAEKERDEAREAHYQLGRAVEKRESGLRARAEAAEARVAALEAIQKIAHVQVDEAGDLWLHLDGGENYKASFNITAKVTNPRGVIAGGVRQATEALRALLAEKPAAEKEDA